MQHEFIRPADRPFLVFIFVITGDAVDDLVRYRQDILTIAGHDHVFELDTRGRKQSQRLVVRIVHWTYYSIRCLTRFRKTPMISRYRASLRIKSSTPAQISGLSLTSMM